MLTFSFFLEIRVCQAKLILNTAFLWIDTLPPKISLQGLRRQYFIVEAVDVLRLEAVMLQ